MPRLFEPEKSYSSAELYCPVGSSNENIYVYDACHKYLPRNEMSCQAVFNNNKMSLDPISDKLKDLQN